MRKRDAEKLLKKAKEALQKAQRDVEEAEEILLQAEGKQKFKCVSCGHTAPYSKTTLFLKWYTEKGLGYEDDRVHFGEYNIICSHCGVHHRFLKKQSMDKYQIPYAVVNRYGREYTEQTEYGPEATQFQAKFAEVKNSDDYGNTTHPYRFINVDFVKEGTFVKQTDRHD